MSAAGEQQAPLWRLPASDLSLGADEVHVWRVALNGSAGVTEGLVAGLSDDERARAARLRRPQDRDSFVMARGALRAILGRYLRLPPASLVFAYGARGKPSLAVPPGGTIRFNLSHSRQWALYAFARDRELGIDIEFMREGMELERLAQRFFAPGEMTALASLPPPLRHRGFFLCWSRKEALLKACGEGLAIPLDAFEVALAPDTPAALLRVNPDQAALHRWELRDLDVAAGYAAAVAVEGSGWSLSLWHWPESGAEEGRPR